MSDEVTAPETNGVETEQRKRSATGIINIVINVILVLAIILAAVCTYVSFVSTSGNGVPSLFGYELFSVQTDSMYPALKTGDLVIDRAVDDAKTLRKGDIITYWTVIEGERVLNTHRINEIYDGGSYLIFETKGDNNSAADSLTVHESEIVGIYKTRIGGLGKVFDYLQTSTGFLIVVLIPVAVFFLFHLIQFFRVLFEYQNIKSRLKYQEELDALGVFTEPQEPEQNAPPAVDKAQLEAQLREQLKAEMMAEMLAELKKQTAAAPEPPPEEPEPEEGPTPEEPPKEEPIPEEEPPEEEPEPEEEPTPEEPESEVIADEAE